MKSFTILFALVTMLLLSVSSVFAEEPPTFVRAWGSHGTSDGQFLEPNGVALDQSGNVFVVDSYRYMVEIFTNTGSFLTKWTGLCGPQAIAVDASGFTYISDIECVGIWKYASNGTYLMRWDRYGTGDEQCRDPHGVTVDGLGNVFVVDASSNRVQKFTNTGTFLTKWGSSGTGDGQFNYPTGIAIDKDGNVFVVDCFNNRIQKFTNTGTFLTKWGVQGSGDSQFLWPNAVATDQSGNVYVTDSGNNRIQKFTNTGTFLTKWGSPGTRNGQFSNPWGIAVDTSENVFVTDRDNYRVQEFSPQPRKLPVLLVHGLCSDGSVWNDFATYLTQRGYRVYNPSLTPNNGNINALSVQIDAALEHIVTQEGAEKVNVVAHSMGGLVTRHYVRLKRSGSRIATLITLGTPHHGSDLASFAYKNKTLARYLGKVEPCLVLGPAIGDLQTGSESINILNYGYPNSPQNPNGHDVLGAFSGGSHSPEIDHQYDAGLKEWALAGTLPFGPPVSSFSGLIWGAGESNDGLVGTSSARLYCNGVDHFATDGNLGLGPKAHFWQPLLYSSGLLVSGTLTGSPDLFPIIENLLAGGSLPTSSNSSPSLAFRSQQTAAQGDTVMSIVLSEDGDLGPNQTVERPFMVPSTPSCQVSMVADGATFKLRMPNGTLLVPADTMTYAWLHYVEDANNGLGVYTLDNPSSGTWQAVVDGSAYAQSQGYAVTVVVVTTKKVVLEQDVTEVNSPGSAHLKMHLDDAGTAIPGSAWSIVVTKPDSSTASASAFDDGSHNDGVAGDGVFGADVPISGPLGQYRVDVKAIVLSDSSTYIDATMFELRHINNLAMVGDVSVGRNLIVAGDSAVVSATVQNLGVDAVNNVKVEFYDGSTRFSVDSLSLNSGASQTVSALWHAAAPDTHVVSVVVSPFSVPSESSYVDNTITRTIVLGQNVNAVDDLGTQSRFSLGPALPNPSIGSVEFRFSTPFRAPATFSIYDVQGRKIKYWQWRDLPAGAHAFRWNGSTDNGHAAPTGVLFVRLVMNGRVATGKIVRLR